MDIYKTFDILTDYTTPYGEESYISDYISDINKDVCNNYFITIGSPNIMYCCHLDNFCNKKEKVTKKYNDGIISTDGSTILGADDKAGVSLMLNMIYNNIEGLYYFFIGEEKGCIGSTHISYYFDMLPQFNNIIHCISFDRNGTTDIITAQNGIRCCSNLFANTIKKNLSNYGLSLDLNDNGKWSDSASFIGLIPECVNISVGYYNNHTSKEYQDMNHLKQLSDAFININWKF